MKTCLIHVGSPKTGTTSIQRTLGWNLRDPRFRLISKDDMWGNLAIGSLFLTSTESRRTFHIHRLTGWRLKRVQANSRRHLESSLRQAHRKEFTPIISGEIAYQFTSQEFERLRSFLADHGFQSRIVVCLRPTLDIQESGYQQYVKMGDLAQHIKQEVPGVRIDYRQHISIMDQVFGRENVDAFVFNPATFSHGCAVMNFCQRYGIEMSPDQVLRENEGVNLNAMKLLSAWNSFGPPPRRGGLAFFLRHLLLRKLRDLPGPRFEFHSERLAWSMEHHLKDQAWIEERIGAPFPATLRRRDPDEGIRTDDDLLDFSPDVLDWLARQTGQKVLTPGRGEATARQVVDQMKRLRLVTDPAVLSTELGLRLKARWSRLRQSLR
jgi:hypothetical protein